MKGMFKLSALAAGMVLSVAMQALAGLPREPSLAPVLQQVLPGVVSLSVRTRIQPLDDLFLSDPFFQNLAQLICPDAAPLDARERFGSGVIVDAAHGYILTNRHLVKGAKEITVRLHDRRLFSAEIIGCDRVTDLAVVKIRAEDLTALRFGDSDQLEIGDYVIAIGAPFGLSHTATSGIVSGLGRTGLGTEGDENFIQTDAAINPGNSGGALVNLGGELVGINTAMLAPADRNVGIGFAIPCNTARKVMVELIEHGEVPRGRLGFHAQDLTPELADALGLLRWDGALVALVVEGSPAARAGILPGDVVTAIDDVEIPGAAKLRSIEIGRAHV